MSRRRTKADCEAEIVALRRRLARTIRDTRRANHALRYERAHPDELHYRVGEAIALTRIAARGERWRPKYRSGAVRVPPGREYPFRSAA